MNTVIRCARGETIQLLTLDTTLPRYYTRDFTVRGTKAMYEEKHALLLHRRRARGALQLEARVEQRRCSIRKSYEHPVWQRFLSDGVTGGHGGMDGLVYGAFVDCLRNGWDMPIDVYDAAAWMAITALSEESASLNGQPVAIPDFTSGRWLYCADDSMNEYAKKMC